MTNNIKQLLNRVSVELEALIPARDPSELYEPVAYCLKLGGKRMRPLMTLLGCELFGGDVERAMPAALGLELFHNFTLMHDDIMDDAPLRRGKPPVHIRWDVNTAILSGDSMFALASQQMCRVPDKHLRAVMELYNTTVLEVCEGQQYDMNFETIDHVTEAEYLEMIRLKTAVLPAACLKTGAIIGEAAAEDASRLYRFGQLIGIAFQIKDDWLDVFGSEEKFGKKSGGDIVANKKTWLYIKAREMANPDQKKILHHVFHHHSDNQQEKIETVKEIYHALDISSQALALMGSYHRMAIQEFDRIQVSPNAKEDLLSLANELLNREV